MINKIIKEKIYGIKLSGHQIKLIQLLIGNADIQDLLSEQGQTMAKSLYDSLENDSEEIK